MFNSDTQDLTGTDHPPGTNLSFIFEIVMLARLTAVQPASVGGTAFVRSLFFDFALCFGDGETVTGEDTDGAWTSDTSAVGGILTFGNNEESAPERNNSNNYGNNSNSSLDNCWPRVERMLADNTGRRGRC